MNRCCHSHGNIDTRYRSHSSDWPLHSLIPRTWKIYISFIEQINQCPRHIVCVLHSSLYSYQFTCMFAKNRLGLFQSLFITVTLDVIIIWFDYWKKKWAKRELLFFEKLSYNYVFAETKKTSWLKILVLVETVMLIIIILKW